MDFFWRPAYIDISALTLRGCCPLKFLHALEINPGLLVHTPTGTAGVPPPKKKNNRENLKFHGLKFSVPQGWGDITLAYA